MNSDHQSVELRDTDGAFVQVPIASFLEEVAKRAAMRAAEEVLRRHVETCPARNLPNRVGKMEARLSFLVGALIGSGLLGGIVGAGLALLGTRL